MCVCVCVSVHVYRFMKTVKFVSLDVLDIIVLISIT